MQQSKIASLRTPIIRYLLIEKSLVTAKGSGRSLPNAKYERAEIVQINPFIVYSFYELIRLRKMLIRTRISALGNHPPTIVE